MPKITDQDALSLKPPMSIVSVALPVPLRKSFDFSSNTAINSASVGARVMVPFGARKLVGVVHEIKQDSDYPLDKIKPIINIIDSSSLFDESLWKTINWASQYYLAPIGEMIAAALPGDLRKGKALRPKQEEFWSLTEKAQRKNIDELSKAPLQKKIVQKMLKQGDLNAENLRSESSGWRQAIKSLQDKAWVSSYQKAPELCLIRESSNSPSTIQLNKEQAAAVRIFNESILQNDFFAALLYGVTGSGKTEVYFEIVRKFISNGQQVLIIVPEIGLTPQLVSRINSQFEAPLVLLHSGLNDTERHLAWWQAKEGMAQIILGTRSAVFTPCANLGLIVIDEEQDSSLKQQDGVRYHARDVAIYRAKQVGIPIILGSATPSLESYANAQSGRFQLLSLKQRAMQALLPTVKLVDLNTQPTNDGLSQVMLDAIQQTLSAGKQVILYLNRRGYAPVLFCADCRQTMGCQRCDSNLTIHRQLNCVRCHHCGYEGRMPEQCSSCNSTELHEVGEGTQRVEQALEQRFSQAKILRIDRDNTTRKGQLDSLLEQARKGDADILLGTQLLTKGHDFPNVSLVGVLNADQGLYSTDFRSSESLFQQIIQVAGRAGRRDQKGQVLIQTAFPEHPFFEYVCEHDFTGFANELLEQRKLVNFPPFGFFALLHAESPHQTKALHFLKRVKSDIQLLEGVTAMDVIPAPMERRAGRYRAQLLFCASQRSALNATLSHWLMLLETDTNLRKLASSVRWNIDIDPANLY